jgi:hypothetical protein
MSSPNVISPQTNAALHDAAVKYSQIIDVPCYLEGADGFAITYLGKSEDGLEILVTGDEEHLAISVNGRDGKSKGLVNVDLTPPDSAPASIVEPGLYNEQGERDAEIGKYARPVLRALTEVEGQELTMDLHTLIAKMPEDRRI